MPHPIRLDAIEEKNTLEILFNRLKAGPKELRDQLRAISHSRGDVVIVGDFAERANCKVVDQDLLIHERELRKANL